MTSDRASDLPQNLLVSYSPKMPEFFWSPAKGRLNRMSTRQAKRQAGWSHPARQRAARLPAAR
ncbi:hypothetical protein QA942_32355 [Streptomyces sp. B21-106]|uniref:hypothetical protein n=1 Tax=unclassified Streptomyces TaxID=2593676 RepID=UPI002FF41277